jgi:hypothetical protein
MRFLNIKGTVVHTFVFIPAIKPHSMRQPISYNQALKIVSDFNHLKGQPLGPGHYETITQIIITPWDDFSKWMYLNELNENPESEKNLIYLKPGFYDVVLLTNTKSFLPKDIRSFCLENNIPFSLENYATYSDPKVSFEAIC